jgi:transmembrane sensor
LALAASFLIMVGLAGIAHFQRSASSSYTTGVGEQRTVVLQDGSRVILNTDTEILESYDTERRRIRLRKGEALFDVAKDPRRAFTVIAGGQLITALGTTFAVRVENERAAVTLIDGKVAVDELSASRGDSTRKPGPIVLSPGQRLTSSRAIENPSLDRVMSWQRGQLIFEDTPLRDAAAEFNRYGDTKIEIAPGDTGDIPVGGVFRTVDVLLFAQAVAASHDLVVETRGKTLVLAPR